MSEHDAPRSEDGADDGPRRVSVLPPDLANQIAAGEVVERPASVVKELVENSLDAGARHITIRIEDGGRELVAVEDDGCGMERDDALRSLERHATSKLTDVDDLFSIATLGFRGEAIPSIASVSRFEMRTKPHGALEGTRLLVEGGTLSEVEDIGKAAGTTIEVRELFYNTPARKKFLKRQATETRHITRMLMRIALSRPEVHFKLVKDGDVAFDHPRVERLGDRILSVLGREVYDELYPTFRYPAVDGVTARGFFSKPGHTQRTSRHFFTFVNGRFVDDRTIRAAIRGGYGKMIERGRYPSVVLFLDVPLDLVDVNVHPTKTEVRFHDTQSVYRAVYHAIADAIAEAPWVTREGGEGRVYRLDGEEDQESARGGGADPSSGPGPGDAPMRGAGDGPRRASEQTGSMAARSGAGRRGDLVAPGYGPRQGDATDAQQGFRARGAGPLREPVQSGEGGGGPGEEYFSSLRVIGQYRRMYMLCEDASGLVIIDQHAAHERITFEYLREQFRDEHKEVQPLLFPKRLELDSLRATTMSEHLEFFEDAGFEIEPFGGNSFALKAVPAVLGSARHDELVRDVLDDLGELGRSDRVDEAMEALLSRMACHGSVRGPTDLDREECEALLEQMDRIDFRANCPHGRPVYFRLSLAELEKSFDRR